MVMVVMVNLFLKFIYLHIYVVCMHMHPCHSTYVEIKGQLVATGSL